MSLPGAPPSGDGSQQQGQPQAMTPYVSCMQGPIPLPPTVVTATGTQPTFAQIFAGPAGPYGGTTPQQVYMMPGVQQGTPQQQGSNVFAVPAVPTYQWTGQWQGTQEPPRATFDPNDPAIEALVQRCVDRKLAEVAGKGQVQGGQVAVVGSVSSHGMDVEEAPSWVGGDEGSKDSSRSSTPIPSPGGLPPHLKGLREEVFFQERQYRGISQALNWAVLAQYPLYLVEFQRLQPQFLVHAMDRGANPRAFINRRLSERKGVTDAERYAIVRIDQAYSKIQVDPGVGQADPHYTGGFRCLVRSAWAASTLISFLRDEHMAVSGKLPLLSMQETDKGLPQQGKLFAPADIKFMREPPVVLQSG